MTTTVGTWLDPRPPRPAEEHGVASRQPPLLVRQGAVDRPAYRALVGVLFASIFLQRFAVPVLDTIALNLAVTTAAIALLLARGSLLVDGRRLALFLAFAAAVMLSAARNAGEASLASTALLCVVCAPYALSLRASEGMFHACLRAFQTMVLVCAWCGLAQFILQFAIGPAGLFSFADHVPQQFLLNGFNTVIPLRWDSPILKSNGFFFVEPSTFSQYLALAAVFELLFRGMTARLAVYLIALPTSFSGTGLLLLIVMIPLVLLYRRDFRAIAGLGLLGAIALATGDFWHLDALLARTGEFGSTDSSAYARFFAGGRLIGEFLLSSGADLAFGLGPGAFPLHAKLMPYEVHDPAWAKVLFEYGLLGTLLFWPMLLAALLAGVPSRWVGAALLIGYFTFGGMLLDPRMQALVLVFCTLPRRRAAGLAA